MALDLIGIRLVYRSCIYYRNRDLSDWHFLRKPLILVPLDRLNDDLFAGLYREPQTNLQQDGSQELNRSGSTLVGIFTCATTANRRSGCQR